MSKLPNEQEFKTLVTMAKDFEAQIKEQSETARKIAMECEKATSKKSKKQQAK